MSVKAPTFTRVHLRKRLSDSELSGELAVSARRERAALAALLGYLGQFDERKVYAAAGFTSTTAYAVHHFGWSEASSWKRIQAARLCIRFPVLLGVIADGGLHLSGVCMLAPITNDETLPRILVDAPGLKRWELQMHIDAIHCATPNQLEPVDANRCFFATHVGGATRATQLGARNAGCRPPTAPLAFP